jgi:hypothetical protein
MIRVVLLICVIAMLAGLSTPIFGDDLEPEFGRSDRGSQNEEPEPPEGRVEWRRLLLAANQEVAIALKRSVAALRSYEGMRHRRRPRGDAKQAIMDELEFSREGLTTAQQDLTKLEKAARRTGAPPSWLKFNPAEIQAATQAPASQQP